MSKLPEEKLFQQWEALLAGLREAAPQTPRIAPLLAALQAALQERFGFHGPILRPGGGKPLPYFRPQIQPPAARNPRPPESFSPGGLPGERR